MWYHTATGGLAWALGKEQADRFTPWYVDVAGDAAVAYLLAWEKTRPYMKGISRATGRGVHALGRHGARAAYHSGSRALATRGGMATRWVAGTAALYTSAVAVGYTIGAVAGTAISQQLFGKEGARLALDFYTGKGKYGEYFDIVGNFNTVYNALKQGDI